MKKIILVFVMFLFLLSFNAPVFAEPQITIIPTTLDRGHPGRIVISGLQEDLVPQGLFDGRQVFFYPDKGQMIGLFGADIMLSPGTYPLKITWPGGEKILDVPVRDHQYGVRNIKVPPSQVDLSAEDLARVNREKDLTSKALAAQSPLRLWSGPFTEPVAGKVNSSFGRQTKMNGVLKPNPHTGADFRVSEGTAVKAPATGQILLTGDHFFAGKSVYIDHGQGLITMYFHLSAIDVKDGELVNQGQQLGLSGKTGRVSGAHLHYGLYLNGARIDPLVFHKLSSQK